MTRSSQIRVSHPNRLSRWACVAFGAIAFFSASAVASAQSALPIFVADFNHDGIPDALVLSTSSPTATIAFGSVPYGTFSGVAKGVTFPNECTAVNTEFGSPPPIVIADFNSDGYPDIAFDCQTNSNDLRGVILGNGDGSFGSPILLTDQPAYVYEAFLAADFNGDGKVDLAVIALTGDQEVTQQIRFYPGDGTGHFGTAVVTNISQNNSNDGVYSALQVDLNNDGHLDLVLLSASTLTLTLGTPNQHSTISVFGNNQDGTFGIVSDSSSSPNTTVDLGPYTTGIVPQSVFLGSVFSTSGTDLIMPDTGSTPGVATVRNTSTPTTYSLAPPARTSFPSLMDLRPGSFTGTAFSDLAVVTATGITVLANDGTGNFTLNYAALTAVLPSLTQSTSAAFAIADANFDGYSDIYTAYPSTTGGISLNVSLVNGSATATATPIPLPIGTQPISAAWPGNVNSSHSTATGTQIVQGVPSAVTLTSSKNPATLGNTVTFNVSVASLTASSVIPTGALVLTDDGNPFASGTLTPAGTFSFATSALNQGSHSIVATYAGDNLFAGALSTPLTQLVNHAVAIAPILTWPTPASITYGTPLSSSQLDAVATDANGATIPGTYVYTPAAGTTLIPGTHTLSITFTPVDPTAFTTVTATVQIAVAFGQFDSLSPSVVVFPRQVVGTSSEAVTINVPIDSTDLQGFIISASGDFSQTSSCNAEAFDGEGGCYIQVTFTPTTAGSRTGILTLASPDGSSSITTALSGVALTAGTLPSTTSTSLAVMGALGKYTLTATVTGNLGVGDPSGSVSFVDTTANSSSIGAAAVGPATITTGLTNGPSTVTGSESSQIVTTDLNGDGRPDLVVLNLGSPDNEDPSLCSLNIRLGNGDGTFTAKPALPSTYCAQALAVGDFNGDGKVDIALAPSGTNFIVYFGNGDGTFSMKSIPLTSDPGDAIASGDFNGDGNSDLVVSTGSTIILLGQSDGTFVTRSTTQNSGGSPLLVADFNGDGKADYAFGTSDGAAACLGNGDGTFQSAVQTFLHEDVIGGFDLVGAGDFTGDGKADLIFTESHPETDKYLVLVGKGDGTFSVGSPVATSTPIQGGSNYPTAVVADFNGDGLADFAFLDDFAVQVFLSNGDGTFELAAHVDSGANTDPDYLSVAAADFNGDGLPDIIGVDSDTNLATVSFTQRTETATATLPNITVLGPGDHLIEAVYAGDAKFLASTSPTVAVQPLTQATPTLTWPTPASIAYGAPLGAAQLDATVTGANGVALAGTLTYTPPAGTILAPGTHTLSVRFVPADAIDYLPVSGTVQLAVIGLTPTAIAPSSIPAGSGATTVTITGSGFAPTATVQVNGASVPSTVVSLTTLTAVIPVGDFTQTGTLQVVVTDPATSQTAPALTVTVIPASPAAILTGPTTTNPGTQPTIDFTLQAPYPVALTGTLDLSFASAVSPAVDDPAIQFAAGGRTLTFDIPAETTAVPTIQLQAGTVAGTITVPLILTANGANVTPASIQPVVIVIHAAVPAVSSATISRSGDQLTVVMHGFSNTREVTQSTFHFAGISGAQIDTPDVTVQVAPTFAAWYASAASDQYGSTFTYTQTFTVGGGATNIDSVQVTLTNTVGVSIMQTAQ